MRSLFVSALFLGGCAATDLPPPPDLAGSEWGLGDSDDTFLRFDAEGRVSGFAGCNALGADYTLDGDALAFGPVRATRKMCPTPEMEREARFMAALDMTRTVRLDGDMMRGTLRLIDANGRTLMAMRRRDWD